MCRYFDVDALNLSSWCKKNGIKVIYHIDDLLYDPSPEVLDEVKYKAYRKRAPIIIDLIKQSDLVYCSTPALSKEISSYIHHPNIQHGKIYKSVDTSTILYKRDRKKVIGYTGFGHTQDLESIEEVILEVLNKYQDWSLELIGTIVPSEKLLALDKRLTIITPERNYEGFISLLKSRNWSIGICPLINNKFNSVKANTKWVEYSCCNIATIATNLDPYCYGSPKNSLILCDSPVAWKDAFFQLINSEDLVNSLIKNSQDYIRSHYSDEALSNQVLDICDGLIKTSDRISKSLLHNLVHLLS